MNIRNYSAALGLGVVLSLMQGCQTLPWVSSQDEYPPVEMLDEVAVVGSEAPAIVPDTLPLSTDQRFKDVPLPADVNEDLERSYVFESADLQIGRMVYTSRATINELANFFIKECPAAEWRLESALQAAGGHILVFKKLGKRLEVQVQNQGTGRSRMLILNLTPENGMGK